jgi:hypothetical protein
MQRASIVKRLDFGVSIACTGSTAQTMRPAIVKAYASILNALEGADARTVMLKMSAAGQLLGATEAERDSALGLCDATEPAPVPAASPAAAPAAAPAAVDKAPLKRGLKRKAVEPLAPGTKFQGKYVRVWWGEPYNAFYVGHVVDYQPDHNTYKVVYNEGTPQEEHAQEDLESMPPLSCKVVAPPKSTMPKPKVGPMTPPPCPAGDKLDAYMNNIDVRIDKANSLDEISALSGEIDARVVQLKAMLEALGPDSDSEEDEAAACGDAEAVALLATKQATELGLDLDEALCEAGAHTPRGVSIAPMALRTATPVQPMRETPTSARALVAIDAPVVNNGASPESDGAPPDDDGAPLDMIDFVPEWVSAFPEQEAAFPVPVLQLNARNSPRNEAPTLARDDAPLELVLEAAHEDLSE